jgi:hypothetical protein
MAEQYPFPQNPALKPHFPLSSDYTGLLFILENIHLIIPKWPDVCKEFYRIPFFPDDIFQKF